MLKSCQQLTFKQKYKAEINRARGEINLGTSRPMNYEWLSISELPGGLLSLQYSSNVEEQRRGMWVKREGKSAEAVMWEPVLDSYTLMMAN